VDGHSFPNLALMKLSAYHKARGDTVEWWWSDIVHYDVVYMSKVFSNAYSPDIPEPLNADRVIKGGTGYGIAMEGGKEVYEKEADPTLPPEIEHTYPDYSIYEHLPHVKNTAYGFLTRGCTRGCGFCHVPCKEGVVSHKVADLTEFWSGQRNIEIMDPNILACKERMSLLKQLTASRAYVNFNQGLDIRLMTKEVADLLGAIRVKRVHFAWDNPIDDLRPHFKRFTAWYRRKDPSRKVVYVLTNFGSTTEQDLYRIYALRDLGFEPYVMVYNRASAPMETKHLQRWCNNRIIFKSVPDFRDYDPRRR